MSSKPKKPKSSKAKKKEQPMLPLMRVVLEMAERERQANPASRPKIAATIAQLYETGKRLKSDVDHVEYLVPAGSFLDTVTGIFERTTDIPVKLPLFASLAYISGLLLSSGVRISFGGSTLNPDIWVLALAPSGSGKTITENFLGNLAMLDMFPVGSTAARFVADLRDHNRSLWFQDEFGEFLQRLERSDAHSDMKQYLLQCYDGSKISRRTKGEEIEVVGPALTVLGATVSHLFNSQMTAESMLSGLAQRFQYVLIEDQVADPMPLYTLFEHENVVPAMVAWGQISSLPRHPCYRVSEHGIGAYKDGFRRLFGKDAKADRSFFRRILWRAPRYALIYHFLLGKVSDEIDAEDMTWGLRVCEVHLQDFRRVMDKFEMSSLAGIIEKAELVNARMLKQRGRPATAGDLIAGVRDIKDATTARFVLDVLSGRV